MKENENIEKLAAVIATQAHINQKRKDGRPYIVHPEAMAKAVVCYGPEAQAVAWLHDVLEDTPTTAEDLKSRGVSDSIIQAVQALTRDDSKEDYFMDYLPRVTANPLALVVKIADIKNNMSDMPSPRNIEKYGKALPILESALTSAQLTVTKISNPPKEPMADEVQGNHQKYEVLVDEVLGNHQKYEVLVDDNFHFMDESERYSYGKYDSWDEALAAAKAIVDDFLLPADPDATAAQLLDAYTMMGEDPFIVPAGPNGISFSAWDYAEQRCNEICAARQDDGKTV